MPAPVKRAALASLLMIFAGVPAHAQESPTITTVVLSGRPGVGDTYGPGSEIQARVEFSENVEVGGNPRLVLRIGDRTRSADLYRASGIRLYFRHFVEESDLDEDGVSIPANALLLNRGSIRDSDGNDAVLTHEVVPDDPGHKVNGRLDVVPELVLVQMVGSPNSGDTYERGEPVHVMVRFTEPVFIEGDPKFTLQVGSRAYRLSPHARYSTAFHFEHIVAPEDVDRDGVSIPADAWDLNGGSIKDADGNDAGLSHEGRPDDPRHKVDGAGAVPDVERLGFVRRPGGDVYEAGAAILPWVQFTKPVDVEGEPQLVLQVGAQSRVARLVPALRIMDVSGFHLPVEDPVWIAFEYVVQPSDLDEDGVSIPANALRLNGGSIRAVADGTPADLSHDARGDDPALKVDGGRSDSRRPEVTTVRLQPPVSGVFVAGDTITVELGVSNNVRVTGSPQFMLRIGSHMRAAALHAKWGVTSLLFEYVVTEADRDLNGLSVDADAVDLNGGTIRDNNGNDADLDLGYFAFNDDPNLKVDGVAAVVPALPLGGVLVLAALLAWRGAHRRNGPAPA